MSATVSEVLPSGVDVHAYATLLALADLRPRTQKALAESVSVSRTTLAKVVANLLEDGLVERVPNPEDGRSFLLVRTAEGRRTIERWRAHVEGLESAHGAGFSDEERRELRDHLRVAVDPYLPAGLPDSLLHSTGFLVTRLHALMHARAAEALRDLELEPRDLGTLILLSQERPESQAVLARELGVSQPMVVHIVDALAGAGVAVRVRGPQDRRLNMVELTEHGRVVAKDALERGRAVAREVLGELTSRQRDRLVALLVRLVTGG
ncbi:MarR family transcriptional regulator [Nocardioides anomalus]|uniref:MarR family transcriptional regulator n=1 Tax=Nocardioides anomalus TaxID=2712223 RepID=A0A6G6WJL7_9ACTN|nr:MarR family transcriptional regulator [Nocardioides anomalus]QIG45333.1 MarR family transcriptional regulator [Nocardioides anomalus]